MGSVFASPPFLQAWSQPGLVDVVETYNQFQCELGSRRVVVLHHASAAGQLVFNFGDSVATEAWRLATGQAILLGPTTSALSVTFSGHVDLFNVWLRPTGLAALVREPLHELAAQMLSLLDVRLDLPWQRSASLAFVDRVSLFEAALSARVWRRPRPELVNSVDYMRRRNGDCHVDDLVGSSGLSASQLQRLFRVQVGVSAKYYARLCRAARARQLLLRHEAEPGLADVAQLAGYADQAHMTRDFRALVGATPARWRQRPQALPWPVVADHRSRARPL